jgi:serine O-acetyltransferase
MRKRIAGWGKLLLRLRSFTLTQRKISLSQSALSGSERHRSAASSQGATAMSNAAVRDAIDQPARPDTRPQEISATDPDWTRESKARFEWCPSRALLAAIRDYQSCSGPFAVVRKKWAVLRHRFWSAVTGADVPINSNIGGGLLLPHPNGVVIHPDAVIGPNCLLFQQVTIGSGRGGVPTLGGQIDVGAGAKIIGGVRVGDHARIGANAVVTTDIPAHATAVGIPARVIATGGPPGEKDGAPNAI